MQAISIFYYSIMVEQKRTIEGNSCGTSVSGLLCAQHNNIGSGYLHRIINTMFIIKLFSTLLVTCVTGVESTNNAIFRGVKINKWFVIFYLFYQFYRAWYANFICCNSCSIDALTDHSSEL